MYLKYLKSLPASQSEISATAISKALGLGEVQVRKDLAAVCRNGKPRVGYRISELADSMQAILSDDNPKKAVVVGAGKLGMAILEFPGFTEYGVDVARAFDIDPEKWSDNVRPMSELKDFCSLHQIELGILAVPPGVAESAAHEMVSCGIRGIWCFSSSHLDLPESITVKYENLALSLAHLQNKLTHFHSKQGG